LQLECQEKIKIASSELATDENASIFYVQLLGPFFSSAPITIGIKLDIGKCILHSAHAQIPVTENPSIYIGGACGMWHTAHVAHGAYIIRKSITLELFYQ